MRFLIYLTLLLLVIVCNSSCQKWDDYKKFVPNGEIVYPSISDSIQAYSGFNRVQLSWKHTTDPIVVGYRVYWNFFQDSITITNLPKPGEIIDVIIPISEGSHDFTVKSYDDKNRLSVPRIVPSVRSYGGNYSSSLFNRGLGNPAYSFRLRDNLQLNFNEGFNNEYHFIVKYTNTNNRIDSIIVDDREVISVMIANYLSGTSISYRSGYKPNPDAIDVFYPAFSLINNIAYSYRNVYHSDGTREDYNASGALTNTITINMTKEIDKTDDATKYFTDDLANLANYAPASITLKLNNDNSIDVSGTLNGLNVIENHPTKEKSRYDVMSGKIYLNYKYTNPDGAYRLISEILSPR